MFRFTCGGCGREVDLDRDEIQSGRADDLALECTDCGGDGCRDCFVTRDGETVCDGCADVRDEDDEDADEDQDDEDDDDDGDEA